MLIIYLCGKKSSCCHKLSYYYKTNTTPFSTTSFTMLLLSKDYLHNHHHHHLITTSSLKPLPHATIRNFYWKHFHLNVPQHHHAAFIRSGCDHYDVIHREVDYRFGISAVAISFFSNQE